jgi:tellurite resistance protein
MLAIQGLGMVFAIVVAILAVRTLSARLHSLPSVEGWMTPTRYWTIRFFGGLLLLLVGGAGLVHEWIPGTASTGRGVRGIDQIVGLVGFLLAVTSVSQLVRNLSVSHKLGAMWSKGERAAFLRASPEEQVLLLLLGIAEADGTAGLRERELVRQFVLARFPTQRVRAEIERWLAAAKPPRELGTLAQALALRFTSGECATLYSWCCLVAFADGALHSVEQRALHAVSTGLGLSPRHAQFLFDYAQLASQRNGAGRAGNAGQGQNGNARQGDARGSGSSQRSRTPSGYGTPRERALQTLGLPADATKEQIRQRHRELVRKLHPDANQRLGPIAQQEAAERFKAVQIAYEELTK